MTTSEEFDSVSDADAAGVESASPNGEAQATDDSTSRTELDKSKAQAEENRQLYMRALADFENYKKRTERFMRERSDERRRELLVRLLPVLDNLQRAAGYREQGTPAEQLVDGLLATVKQFTSLLEAEGVRALELKGKAFDPALSEAIATRDDDAAAPNTVVDEARKGYMIGDDVLRPAQVIVSKASE